MEINNLKIAKTFEPIISISESELTEFISKTEYKSFKKKDFLSRQGDLVNEIYFIEKGIIRMCTADSSGKVHTTHFAVENQFIADYSALITDDSAKYSVEALSDTEVIIIPNETLNWFYKKVKEGEKFGRFLWDYYYQYLDNRLHHIYTLSPKERYDIMNSIFPNIHQRVPQHMIASYIGVSKVHLSRIKKGQA